MFVAGMVEFGHLPPGPGASGGEKKAHFRYFVLAENDSLV